ncbi:MAG: hypothetical protein ABSC01_01850, partial [Verrucomicrobiota bacterium]
MKTMGVVSVAGVVLVWAAGIFFGSTSISRAQMQMQFFQAQTQAQVNAELGAMMGMSDEMSPMDAGMNGLLTVDYGTSLWLEITNVSNGLVYLNLHNATNQVYAIWSTTDLLANWQVETEVWPTNQDVMPFTVPMLERQNLFLRAEDWTGVDSNGDGIPDWWIWLYFGNLNETATNLDSYGNTLLYDYSNGLDPNVI